MKRLQIIEPSSEQHDRLVMVRMPTKLFNRVRTFAGQYAGGNLSLYIRGALRAFEPNEKHLEEIQENAKN